ncbi:MAG TPA: hypothetical protein VGM39_25935 [Kofleriaceae bacterium]
MRFCGGLLIALAACGSPPPPKPPAPPVPTTVDEPVRPPLPTCADAAFGVERATKNIRPPDQEIVPQVRAECIQYQWTQDAIACFAQIKSDAEDEASIPCMSTLEDEAQGVLLREIAGTNNAEAEIADVKTRLAAIQIGISSCDEFVQQVAQFMDCANVTPEQRIQLGNETADAWSLSVAKLSLPDKVRMAGACKNSLDSLKHHRQQNAC